MKNIIEKVKEFILKHKKASIIGVALLLVVIVAIIVFVPKNYSNIAPDKDLKDRVRSRVDSTAKVYVMLKYDTSYVNIEIYTLEKESDNTYEAYGKIKLRDKYGDNYSGKFDGTCTIENAEKEDEDITCNLDYGKFYKE